MASLASDTLNGQSLKFQEENLYSFSDVSGNKSFAEITEEALSPSRRLLNLTEIQQKVVKVVRKYPKSDSKTVSEIVNISRHSTLEHLKKLANSNVLKCESGGRRPSGPKATLFFTLADDVPAELVDQILGDVLAKPNPSLEAKKPKSSKVRSKTDSQAVSPLSPPATLFANLSPRTKDLIIEIGRAGEKGISVVELAAVTKQPQTRIYERLPSMIGKLLTRQNMPGFKNRHIYYATSEVREIVDKLFQGQEYTPKDNASNVETHNEPPELAMTVQSSQPLDPQPTEETVDASPKIADILELLAEIAERINSLDERLARIEPSRGVKRPTKVDDIRAILRSKPKQP